jgi:hypothetical protein
MGRICCITPDMPQIGAAPSSTSNEGRVPVRYRPATVRGQLVAPGGRARRRVLADACREPPDAAHLAARMPALRGMAGSARRARGPDYGRRVALPRPPGCRRTVQCDRQKGPRRTEQLLALARRAPRSRPRRPARRSRSACRAQRADREAPEALDEAQYERLLREAKARIADDTLRDHAIVLVLGDAVCAAKSSATSRSATSGPPVRARCCLP